MPLFVIFQPQLPAAAKEQAVFGLPVLPALPLDLSRTSLHESNDHFTDRQTSVWACTACIQWTAISYFAQAAGRESISFLRRRNSTFRAIRETINSTVSGTRT